MVKVMETYKKRNEVLQHLSQAWIAYAKNFPNKRNFEIVLESIQKAQLAVMEEDEGR